MPSRCPREPVRRRVVLLSSAVTAAAVAALAGCASTGEQRAEPAGPAATASPDGREAPDHLGDGAHAAGAALPSTHVHAVAIDPADGRVLLATHEGLFRYDDAGPTRVGPVIDLMGFTVAGPDHFYASGHPGPGVDLPEPVGLIESTDGGQSWSPVSRQGQSDFHALAASSAGVVGFDGAALLATGDGRQWRELHPPVAPYALAAAPDGAVLLATAASGPVRSTDAGATWAPVEGAPLLQVVDWAEGQTVAGVTPEGTIAVSDDAGATWTERAGVGGPPQAVAASLLPDGSLRVVVVTADAILDSRAGGVSLAPFDGA